MTSPESIDSDDFRQRLAEALPSANIPTLLLLLHQFTGEERWLQAPYIVDRSRWDDNDSGGLPDAIQDEVRAAALDTITAWRAGKPIAKPDLTADELIRMMSFSESSKIPQEYAGLM